jgi:hypothetical protein|tara:strand:- start:7032 stop:7352 length:321 start_codon:yes stop_codon:yes gene_type:complete
MLFKEEKRQVEKIKIRPGILSLAKEIAEIQDPFDEEPCIDKLFEKWVTQVAEDYANQGYIFKSIPNEVEQPSPEADLSAFILGDKEFTDDLEKEIPPIEQLLAQEK